MIGFGSAALAQTVEAHSGNAIGPGRMAGSVPFIKSKPEPRRPDQLPNKTTTIVLTATFTEDGKVTDLSFLRATPKGLSKTQLKDYIRLCKAAAREIKFEPAIKDGQSVSMRMMLEYAFAPEDAKTNEPRQWFF